MSYTVTWADKKLNANEQAKLNKDGLDVFKDLPELVKQPFSEVDHSYFMYFKYAGLTVQKPQVEGYFMLRIKIPGGRITIAQGEHIAWLANHYGHGIVDLTTREDVQYHWIPFAELVDIFAGIEAVGLTTRGAEGDITRNVTDNPLSGIDPNELFDTRQSVLDVHRRLQGNYDYSNLPRKFKISVSSNVNNVVDAQIQDLAFVPAVKTIHGRQINGFNVLVGGGLGASPRLADQLDIFVRPERVADVAEAVVGLYRDHGYRRSRSRARLKFLISDIGVANFERLVRRAVPRLPHAGENRTVGWEPNLLGVNPQRQEGYSYLGVSIPAGRMSGDDLESIIDVVRRYGRDEIRFDDKQNLLIPWIRQEDLDAVRAEPIFEKYSLNPHLLADFGNACTGAEYCNLAKTHTKNIFVPLLNELDSRFDFEAPVTITMTGCSNNCAHRSIADIGVEGVRARTPDKQYVEGFRLAVGGSLLGAGHFNEDLKGLVSTVQLPDALGVLLADYRDGRHPSESFYEYWQRTGTEHFQHLLTTYLSQQQEVLR